MKKKNNKENRRLSKSKWMVFGLVLGVVLATVGSVVALNGWFGGGAKIPEDTITRGLVGYWSMDEGNGGQASDLSGNGNTGTLTNGPVWASGKVGGALSFDGANDYVNCGSDDSLNITDAVSLEHWIYLRNNPATYRNIYYKASQFWSRVDSGMIFRTYFYQGAVWKSVRLTNTLSLNTWYHIVVTYDGTSAKAYVNGADDTGTNTVLAGGMDSSTSSALIGTSGATTWNGLLDEVRIYNRALSAEEVRYHYNRGGPVAHWKFDESNGTTTYDGTDNNNDGALGNSITATSMPSWVPGKSGTALSFDGADDYVSAGTGTTLSPSSKITWTAWIKTLKTGRQGIVSRGGNQFQTDSGKMNPYVRIGTDVAYTDYGLSGNINIADDKWHYVAVTYESSDFRIYVDGLLDKSRTDVSGNLAPQTSSPVYIGMVTTNYFNGLIDEVRIYNYTRTADEIKLDYNSGFSARFGPQSSCDDDPGSCMTKGLAGYWPMNEGSATTTYDNSDYMNHGYFLTAAISPQWTVGRVGGALSFDGANDSVNCGNSASLQISNIISLEAWVYLKNLKVGTYQEIIVKYGTYTGYYLNINSSGYFSGAFLDGTDWGSLISDTVIPTINTWYHIVYTYDGITHRMYRNGLLTNSRNDAGGVTETAQSLRIGGYASGRYANAIIDEVRVYNRVLSDKEIRYHYNHGGPIAYWKFDEGANQTAYDESWNNFDGQLGSTTASDTGDPAWIPGKYGGALRFDGVDDYITLSKTGDLDMTGSFTISAWVNLDSLPSVLGYSRSAMVTDRTSCANTNYLLAISTDNKAQFLLTNTGGTWHTATGNTLLKTNVWYFLTGIFDSSASQIRIYLNGVLEKTASVSGTVYSGSNTLWIGGEGCSPPRHVKGTIDDVRIYNYARTPEEIKLDYNSGFAAIFGPQSSCDDDPGSCMSKNLVGYWSMNEGSGQTVYDDSGGNNTVSMGSGSSADIYDPSWTAGKVGGALSFDGLNDYVNIGNPANLQSFPSGITIECWVQRDWSLPIGAKGDERPISKRESAGHGYVLILLSNKTWHFLLADGSSAHNIYSTTAMTGTGWHHIVATYDGKRQRIYIDGVINSTGALDAFTIHADADNLYIGRSYNPMLGKIDEVRIYDRALSDVEVRYHYNRGGPAGHWKFDEGFGSAAYDSTDNNNDCTLQNNMATTSWTKGQYGSALSFDGVDDNLVCGTNASLQLTKNGTVEAWVNLASRTQSDWPDIVGRVSSTDGWELFFSNGDKKFQFGTMNASTQNYVATQKTDWVPGQWYHIVGALDDANSLLKIYVNGVLDNTKAKTQDAGTGTITCKIGLYGVKYFNGLIDDVRVYNYVRTADQIKQDYNAGYSAHFK